MKIRVAVFIDNSNVYKRLTQLNKIDKLWFKSYNPLFLANKLAGMRDLVSVQFYCTPPPAYLLKDSPKKYWGQISYYEAVKKLKKLEVKYGELKGTKDDLHEKNLDTQMTADIITMAFENKYDVALIISNDGDFQSSVKTLKKLKKGVEVVYFKGNVSMSLRQYADVMRRIRRSYIGKLDFNIKENTKSS